MKLIPPELRELSGQAVLTGLVEQLLWQQLFHLGTNETRGKTCQGMPSTCLLVEPIQPWPNWTAMQKCPSFFLFNFATLSYISKRGVLKLYLLQTTPPFYKDSGKDGHFTMLGAPGVTCQDPQLTHLPSSPDPSLLSYWLLL